MSTVNFKPAIADINMVASKQWGWVESVGWHNTTALECIALIASEIGEAAGEYTDSAPTLNFGHELSDIILRTIDLMHTSGIDIQSEIAGVVKGVDLTLFTMGDIAKQCSQWAEREGWHGRLPLESIALISFDLSKAVNECREDLPSPLFGEKLARVILRVADLAYGLGLDINQEMLDKSILNQSRGTRGRGK